MSSFVTNLQNGRARRTLYGVWIRDHEAESAPLVCVWMHPAKGQLEAPTREPGVNLPAAEILALDHDRRATERHRRESKEGLGRSFVLSLLTLFLAYALFPRAARAQTTGKISALVRDQTGSVIPGVAVALRNVAAGVEQTVLSDATGSFTFTALPVGQYELEINLDGFRPYRRAGLINR